MWSWHETSRSPVRWRTRTRNRAKNDGWLSRRETYGRKLPKQNKPQKAVVGHESSGCPALGTSGRRSIRISVLCWAMSFSMVLRDWAVLYYTGLYFTAVGVPTTGMLCQFLGAPAWTDVVSLPSFIARRCAVMLPQLHTGARTSGCRELSVDAIVECMPEYIHFVSVWPSEALQVRLTEN